MSKVSDALNDPNLSQESRAQLRAQQAMTLESNAYNMAQFAIQQEASRQQGNVALLQSVCANEKATQERLSQNLSR